MFAICPGTNVLKFEGESMKQLPVVHPEEFQYTITVTSQWALGRLKLPASRLFARPFVQPHIKENIKVPRHWPLWGNPPVDSPHKGSVTRKVFPFDDVIKHIKVTV